MNSVIFQVLSFYHQVVMDQTVRVCGKNSVPIWKGVQGVKDDSEMNELLVMREG